MRKPVVITTPIPSDETVRKMLGLTRAEAKWLEKLAAKTIAELNKDQGPKPATSKTPKKHAARTSGSRPTVRVRGR